MEQKIKDIVSVFTRIPAAEIGPGTLVDRSVLKSSIHLHRMYARLADEGIFVVDYQAIRNFGDLLKIVDAVPQEDAGRQENPVSGPETAGRQDKSAGANGQGRVMSEDPVTNRRRAEAVNSVPAGIGTGIGIDIEEIGLLPRTNDFRKETFYKMNFAASEIAYCILQADPYASFAGLFAAKEAMVKAGHPGLKKDNFCQTLIDHNPEGKPLHPDYDLSISHAGGVAVAVAIAAARNPGPVFQAPPGGNVGAGKPAGFWLAWLAIILSIITLVISLAH